jgi:hypothetical protein
MKTPNITFLNSLGFTNIAQKAFFAATLLSIGTYPQKAQSFAASGAKPLFKLPVINPILPFAGTASVEFIDSENTWMIKAKLPYNYAKVQINDSLDLLTDFYEITPSTLLIDRWDGEKASSIPENNAGGDPPTIEGYLALTASNTYYNIKVFGTAKAKELSFWKPTTLTDSKGIKIPIYDCQLFWLQILMLMVA